MAGRPRGARAANGETMRRDPSTAPGPGGPPAEERHRALDRLAGAALARYPLPPGAEARLLDLSENATFRVDAPATGERWALRVHREGYHPRAAIVSELAWLDALRRDRVAVIPTPLPGTDGERVQTVPDEGRANGSRHVVLFAWETGEEPREDRPDLRDRFEGLGELAARLHVHARRWRRPAGFQRFRWDFDTTLGRRPRWGAWRGGLGLTPEMEPLFAATARRIARRLARFGAAPDRFGLIHGDMRLANLLIDGGTTKLLDFDDCGFGWLMYDCATTLSFFEHRSEAPELVAAWVRGYRRVRDLPEESVREIPTFVMLRRLLLVAWIGSHAQTATARALGGGYTEGTVPLCERYLARSG